MSPKYDLTQQLFCLSMLIQEVKNRKGIQQVLRDKLDIRLREILLRPSLNNLIGDWEIAWGPAIYQVKNSRVADNTMTVFRNQTTSQVVIAISGTNAASLYGWLVEDFYVNKTKPWPFYAHEPIDLVPQVARGSLLGYEHLVEDMKPEEVSLFEWLADYMAQAKEPLEMMVTGHSLGGALSYLLGLAMMEQQQEWDPQQKATTSIVTFGAPTVGNVDFVRYAEYRLQNQIKRIWNPLDMVTYAWDKDLIEKMKTLYSPTIEPDTMGKTLLKAVKFIAHKTEYKHICEEARPLSGAKVIHPLMHHQVEKPDQVSSFFDQVFFQHVLAYFQLLGTNGFLCYLSKT